MKIKPIEISKLKEEKRIHTNIDRDVEIYVKKINNQLLNSSKSSYNLIQAYLDFGFSSLDRYLEFRCDDNYKLLLRNKIIKLYEDFGYKTKFHMNVLTIYIDLNESN